jgi:hypothetical protein
VADWNAIAAVPIAKFAGSAVPVARGIVAPFVEIVVVADPVKPAVPLAPLVHVFNVMPLLSVSVPLAPFQFIAQLVDVIVPTVLAT